MRVSGLDISETIGQGTDKDIYLDGATTSGPTLYHDFSGDDWPEKLRRHLAPHLAALIENPAYTDVFALLLQQDEPSEMESFLLDKGVSTVELEKTRDALDIAETASQQQEMIWWTAVLSLLGVSAELDPERPLHEQLEHIFEEDGIGMAPLELGGVLLSAGGGDRVRCDTSPSGALYRLEADGHDLRSLHERLISAGDSGLQIEIGATRLRNWRASFGRRVALLLSLGGWSAVRAKKASRYWQLSEALCFKIDLELMEVIEPVVTDLTAAGYEIDALRLTSEDSTDYLVELSGLDEKTFNSRLRGLFDAEERARLQRTIIVRARESAISLLTAILSDPSGPDFRVLRVQEGVAK